MNDTIRVLPGTGERDPDAILECARNAGLEAVVILGWTGEDTLYFSSSYSELRDVLWDVELVKKHLLE